MASLEFLFHKTLSTQSDIRRASGPANFENALGELISFCEKQLPSIFETDFIPVSFDISKDETIAVLGGKHGNIGTYEFLTKRVIRDEEISRFPLLNISLMANDTQIVALTSSNELFFMEFPSYILIQKLDLKNSPIMLKIHPEKNLLYLSNSTAELTIFNIDTQEEVDDRTYSSRIIAFDNNIKCIDISDDGFLFALGFDNGIITLMHEDSESELQSTNFNESNPNILCFSEHRRFLAAGFEDFGIKV